MERTTKTSVLQPSEEHALNVGKRMKALRIRSGLTLRQLARESGVGFTTIQKIEAGIISPTVSTLMKIAQGLKVKTTSLLEEEAEARTIHFVGKDERMKVDGHQQNIDIQYVAHNLIDPEMIGLYLSVGPDEESGIEPLMHGGEEIVIGVQGTMTFTVGDKDYDVTAGDCLHFKSSIPHRWMNTGRKPAKLYFIFSEPGLTPTPPDQI